jgi:hypothetical protein
MMLRSGRGIDRRGRDPLNWLLLMGLCIIWGAFLLPPRNRSGVRGSDFERKMRVLSEIQEPATAEGRWVLMPRQDERFVGTGSRSRVRARERRRRVLTVLGEAMGFTALIGAFPPLRAMWVFTAVFGLLLCAYVLLLLRVRAISGSKRSGRAVSLPDTDIAVLRSPSGHETARPHRRHAAAR